MPLVEVAEASGGSERPVAVARLRQSKRHDYGRLTAIVIPVNSRYYTSDLVLYILSPSVPRLTT